MFSVIENPNVKPAFGQCSGSLDKHLHDIVPMHTLCSSNALRHCSNIHWCCAQHSNIDPVHPCGPVSHSTRSTNSTLVWIVLAVVLVSSYTMALPVRDSQQYPGKSKSQQGKKESHNSILIRGLVGDSVVGKAIPL